MCCFYFGSFFVPCFFIIKNSRQERIGSHEDVLVPTLVFSSFSSIRTMTVGFGFTPNLLTLQNTGARGLKQLFLPPVGTFTLP